MQMEIDSGTSEFFLGLNGPSDPITNTQICFLIFCLTESHLNWKKGTTGDFHSEQLLHEPKSQQGFL